MVQDELQDIWRERHDISFDYTWARKQVKNRTLARLDFLLTTNNMLSKIRSIEIGNPTSISDHRPLTFVIAANSLAAGSGFWRFNNNLLTDINFVNTCKQTIKTTVTEYALDNDIPSHLSTHQITDLPSTLKPPALLDMILCKSRQTAMNFMAEQKRKEGQVVKNLETK